MQHETSQTIRRHRDGSIDTAYYLQRGRIARSRAAYAAASGARTGVRSAIERLVTKANLFPAAHRTSIS